MGCLVVCQFKSIAMNFSESFYFCFSRSVTDVPGYHFLYANKNNLGNMLIYYLSVLAMC